MICFGDFFRADLIYAQILFAFYILQSCDRRKAYFSLSKLNKASTRRLKFMHVHFYFQFIFSERNLLLSLKLLPIT